MDQSTYEKVVRNAGYPWLSQNLAGGGSCANPSNGATVLKYIESKITETQVAIWKNDNTKEIIVAIPGTNGVHDVVTDVSIILVPYIAPNIKCPSPCKVHVGFLAAWNSVASDVMNEVQSALASNPGYTTTVSGHSLGGGVAALAFASLKNGDFKVTQGYTYGQPRTGNKAFANYIDTVSGASDSDPGVLYRVTHADGKTLSFRNQATEGRTNLVWQIMCQSCPQLLLDISIRAPSTGSLRQMRIVLKRPIDAMVRNLVTAINQRGSKVGFWCFMMQLRMASEMQHTQVMQALMFPAARPSNKWLCPSWPFQYFHNSQLELSYHAFPLIMITLVFVISHDLKE